MLDDPEELLEELKYPDDPDDLEDRDDRDEPDDFEDLEDLEEWDDEVEEKDSALEDELEGLEELEEDDLSSLSRKRRISSSNHDDNPLVSLISGRICSYSFTICGIPFSNQLTTPQVFAIVRV